MRRFLLAMTMLCMVAIPASADMDVLANLPKETKFVVRADAASLLKSELGAFGRGHTYLTL